MLTRVIGKHLEDIIPVLQKHGFQLTTGAEETPDLVVAHGGDGTLFEAERLFPGIPKLPLRDAGTAPLCAEHELNRQLEDFLAGKKKPAELIKLEAVACDRVIKGINDIFLHHVQPGTALRYRVWIDDILYANEVVGDGVGLATVHGSTAYYRSITSSIFRVGIGLAFNNSTEVVNHLVISENSVVRVKIIRNDGVVVADNSPNPLELSEGEEFIMRKSSDKALVYGLDVFMCSKCRVLRHPSALAFRCIPVSELKKESR